MDQPFIAVSSITYALKGRDLLRKMGFGAYVERTPEHQNRTGCGYGIYDALRRIAGVRLYTGRPSLGQSVPLLAFNIGEMSSSAVAGLLNRRGIAVRAGLHCAPAAHRAFGTLEQGVVRVCPSVFTTNQEMASFKKAVADILREARNEKREASEPVE